MSILVDTGAWYAVANRSGRHHADASHFYTENALEGSFVTTALIVAETCSLLGTRLGRPAALSGNPPQPADRGLKARWRTVARVGGFVIESHPNQYTGMRFSSALGYSLAHTVRDGTVAGLSLPLDA